MLGICFVAALAVLGYQAQAAVIQDSTKQTFGVKVENSVKALCLKNADEATYQQAFEKLDHIRQSCWRIDFIRTSQSDEERTRACVEHQQNMIHCIKQFLEKFEPCLGEDEKYISDLVTHGYGNYSTYLCEHILELVPERLDTTALACFAKFSKSPDNDPSRTCYQNSQVFGSDSATDLTKPKLCSDFRNARQCYGDKFEEHCPAATKSKDLVLELLGKALLPCEDAVEEEEHEASENKVDSSE